MGDEVVVPDGARTSRMNQNIDTNPITRYGTP